MKPNLIRSFCFDNDICEVIFRYEPKSDRYFGDYPDFEETPRYTPTGKPWVTAMQDGCLHGSNKFASDARCLDCGSCTFFRNERPGDLIGICENPKCHKTPNASTIVYSEIFSERKG